MCWVIPPASWAATSVLRMASRSEVLPWSTWPSTATTGGRGSRRVSSWTSSSRPSRTCSTAGLGFLISTSRLNSRARTWTVSSSRLELMLTITPPCMRERMRSGTRTEIAWDSSFTVMGHWTEIFPAARVGSWRPRRFWRTRVLGARRCSRRVRRSTGAGAGARGRGATGSSGRGGSSTSGTASGTAPGAAPGRRAVRPGSAAGSTSMISSIPSSSSSSLSSSRFSSRPLRFLEVPALTGLASSSPARRRLSPTPTRPGRAAGRRSPAAPAAVPAAPAAARVVPPAFWAATASRRTAAWASSRTLMWLGTSMPRAWSIWRRRRPAKPDSLARW
jgi:hypothetical protein